MKYRQITITLRAAVADYGATDGAHQALGDALASRAAGAVRDGVLVADVAASATHAPIPVPASAESPTEYARAYVQAGVA